MFSLIQCYFDYESAVDLCTNAFNLKSICYRNDSAQVEQKYIIINFSMWCYFCSHTLENISQFHILYISNCIQKSFTIHQIKFNTLYMYYCITIRELYTKSMTNSILCFTIWRARYISKKYCKITLLLIPNCTEKQSVILTLDLVLN